ncbi:hypothetical protein Q5P01_010391 [Channa striata]|uniref:Uncharacterized protein n=1 Tax=Channa striata TaxID=64152 RepID=A0AA88SYB4_CHASR|nr:hypothetical protein Q5P01_010391 [Channa striata]
MSAGSQGAFNAEYGSKAGFQGGDQREAAIGEVLHSADGANVETGALNLLAQRQTHANRQPLWEKAARWVQACTPVRGCSSQRRIPVVVKQNLWAEEGLRIPDTGVLGLATLPVIVQYQHQKPEPPKHLETKVDRCLHSGPPVQVCTHRASCQAALTQSILSPHSSQCPLLSLTPADPAPAQPTPATTSEQASAPSPETAEAVHDL